MNVGFTYSIDPHSVHLPATMLEAKSVLFATKGRERCDGGMYSLFQSVQGGSGWGGYFSTVSSCLCGSLIKKKFPDS